MTSAAPGTPATRLGRLASRAREQADARAEHCEFCSVVIPAEHRHVLDLRSGELRCACRPCALLFDRDGAHSGHFRAVGERRLALPGLELADERWAALGVPVDMAFLVRSSLDGRVRALYPSPAGITEAALDATGWWDELARADARLRALADDVEALLVDRVRTHRRQWIVPLSDAYRVVALVRTHWRGITGGTTLWRELDALFAELDRTARPAPVIPGTPPRGGEEEPTWPA